MRRTGQQKQRKAQVDQQHGERCPATHAEGDDTSEESNCTGARISIRCSLWLLPEASRCMKKCLSCRVSPACTPTRPGGSLEYARWSRPTQTFCCAPSGVMIVFSCLDTNITSCEVSSKRQAREWRKTKPSILRTDILSSHYTVSAYSSEIGPTRLFAVSWPR